MLCLSGKELQEYISEEVNSSWEQRDFLSCLEIYAKSKKRKVLGISGLRGTGKTVGLLQFLKDKDGVYITAEKNEKETASDYIKLLEEIPQDIIVLDEYTWISDKDDLDAYLFTLAQHGKRVFVTGTESIAIEYLRYGELIHRIDVVNVNHFSYDEFCRMNHLKKNKLSCELFLQTSGVFDEYVIDNFKSMTDYVKTAVIDNLTASIKTVKPEYASAIVYAILYKAVCESSISSVPQLKARGITLGDLFASIGIDNTLEITPRDFKEVSSILHKAGVITILPNYENKTEYRTYITNPALTYQMIDAIYDLTTVSETTRRSVLGFLFEASCVVHARANLIEDGLSKDTMYYLNGKDGEYEIDFMIVGEPGHKYAHLFECKLNDGPVVKPRSSIVSSTVEDNLADCDILSRYVVYNGEHNYDIVNGKEILYVGMDSILSNYHSFSANKRTILEEVLSRGEKTYLEEKTIDACECKTKAEEQENEHEK